MYSVYIIQSIKGRRTYTGYTKDLKKRLLEHNAGRVLATKHRKPLELLILESFKTSTEAKKREIWWKSSAGRNELRNFFKTLTFNYETKSRH